MNQKILNDLVSDYISWFQKEQKENIHIRANVKTKVLSMLEKKSQNESDALYSYNISSEELVIAVAANLIAMVIKDGITSYLLNKDKYHNEVKKKAKGLTINALNLLENLLRYTSEWITKSADKMEEVSKKMNIE